jgi:hypothetical protein
MVEIECIACNTKLELPMTCDMDECKNELTNDEGSVILCDGTGNFHICIDCGKKLSNESCSCGNEDCKD